MSLGYAERLSYREHVGRVGMEELFDTAEDVEVKIKMLVDSMQRSKHTVVFTGAGISTASGIPDFRGPNGIWTLQKAGKSFKPSTAGMVQFPLAMPSLTHMAIKGLLDTGKIQFVISQNVDCLHLRSGVPRSLLAELHGNCFREVCSTCHKEYVRDFELETIGMKPTGRRCSSPSFSEYSSEPQCRGRLKDTVLDWEDVLPVSEMKLAEEHCEKADLVICLGTSLRVTPAANLPLKAVHRGGQMIIVNLQVTPKDKKAALIIRAPVDLVMIGVMRGLLLSVPPFVRMHKFRFHGSAKPKGASKMVVKVVLYSCHGEKAPLPFVKSVKINFLNEESNETLLTSPPYRLIKSLPRSTSCPVTLHVQMQNGCMCEDLVLSQNILLRAEESMTLCSTLKVEQNKENDLEAFTSDSRKVGNLRVLHNSESEKEYGLITQVLSFELTASSALSINIADCKPTWADKKPRTRK